MSYLHCPTCACAYNVAHQPACPRCGVRPGTPAEPTDDVIAAVEQLARAMARATPAELAAASCAIDARLGQLALPASTERDDSAPPEILRAALAALAPRLPAEPAPAATDPPRPRMQLLLDALLARVSPARRASWNAILDAALVRLAPRLEAPHKTAPVRSLDALRARVRAPLARARALFARAA